MAIFRIPKSYLVPDPQPEDIPTQTISTLRTVRVIKKQPTSTPSPDPIPVKTEGTARIKTLGMTKERAIQILGGTT